MCMNTSNDDIKIKDIISVEDISMIQLADSFFPTGMYTTSNGLEMLFYKRKVRNEEDIKNILTILLKQQIGPADCVALGNAYNYAQRFDIQGIIDADNALFAIKLVKEIREASIRSGIQMLRCINYMINDSNSSKDLMLAYEQAIKEKKANGVYAVVLALASKLLNIPKYKAGVILLYSFSISVIGAALRLGVINHLQGQKVIHELKPLMISIVRENIDRQLSNMWQFAPEMDIIQMEHEKMSTKMFIT